MCNTDDVLVGHFFHVSAHEKILACMQNKDGDHVCTFFLHLTQITVRRREIKNRKFYRLVLKT